MGSKKFKEGANGNKFFFAFFALFAFFASSSPSAMGPDFKNAPLSALQSRKAEVIRLGQEFEMKIDQEALLEGEGLTVRFDSVLEDSRCPEGVDCIWSGNAKIRLKPSKQKQTPATIELNTDAGAKSSSYLNYEISLVTLKPRPKAGAKLQPNEYKATLVVTKK